MIRILAADIGGTNSRFAHFRADGAGGLELIDSVWFDTRQASSFGSLLEALRASSLSLKPEEAAFASIAVAGPVEKKTRSSPPFIGWGIDLTNSERDFGLRRSVLVNDFVAQAYACRTAPGEQAETVLSGNVARDSAVAVIGAGTGLGKAALLPDGSGGYVALASEGGHAGFPFTSRGECEYLEFLKEETGEVYPTGNAVVSGRGLGYLHRFLTGEDLPPEEVAARMEEEPETLEWAARFYARACRDFALEVLALGGLYIAGGVAAKSPALVRHEAFKKEFRSSPSHARLLERVPVFLIRDEQSGLWGAAYMGLLELQKG